MVIASLSLREDYWETFDLLEDDIEFIYNYLLEIETPLTPDELVTAIVEERIRREIEAFEIQRSSAGDLYFPKDSFEENQNLIFPALGWRQGKVVSLRPGVNPDVADLKVIKVQFENGEEREFASGVDDHYLNNPPEITQDSELLSAQFVIDSYRQHLAESLESNLEANEDFVRVAGRWFPRALLLDVNPGHLNLAEAVLDIAGGGPLPTTTLIKQVELPSSENPKLVEFSLDLGLEEDPRFDEVGPAGEVLWFLKRLEPQEVLETPSFLRYHEIEHDRDLLSKEMLALEQELDDELSPIASDSTDSDDVVISLIFPHWRVGSLPLSTHVEHLFPTAYEAPRIRFMLEDRKSGESFPGWVVPEKRYVIGLQEWYQTQGLMPGSFVRVQRGKDPGRVLISADSRRSSREWIRTVLVGSDGGTVFAMLKQVVAGAYDERMAIAVPDINALNNVWERIQKERLPFERVLVDIVRELTKMNPQGHVHATELYAAVNIVRRCPPGPIFALLSSRPWFEHVGDLHFRFDDSGQVKLNK
jgi:hypothetical protein